VIGVGGLGHMAVQILRALSGARIVAVDLDESKLALVREVGADDAIRSGEAAAEEVRELTRALRTPAPCGTEGASLARASARREAGE